MKKLYIIALSTISLNQLHSQTTLTKALNEPVVGDSYDMKLIDTTNALPLSVVGSGATWNISGLLESGSTITNTFTAPSSYSNASNYPGTTVVQSDGQRTSFFKSTASTYELQGTNINMFGITIDINYNTNSGILTKYPTSFGDTYTDLAGGNMTVPTTTLTLTGPFTSTITSIADGEGTLALNGVGIFPNCLRVKTVQNIQFSLTLGLITGTIDQTNYDYYQNNSKFPIFSASYTHVVASGAQNIDQTQVVISANSSIVLGKEEGLLNDQSFNIFPNPAKEEITVALNLTQPEEQYAIELVNTLGQSVKHISSGALQSGNNKFSINIQDVNTGIYFVKINGKKTQSVKKLIIE